MNTELLKKCKSCEIEKPKACFINFYGNVTAKCTSCVLARRRQLYAMKKDENLRENLKEELNVIHGTEVEAYTGYLFMEAIA